MTTPISTQRPKSWRSRSSANAGQVCIAPTRFLIQQGVYEAFVEKFTAAVRELKLGNGLEDGVTMARCAGRSRRQYRGAGAGRYRPRSEGQHRRQTRAGKGNFFEPTVLRDVPLSARAMSEEPFGPVALLRPFATYDEAIAEANRLPYGWPPTPTAATSPPSMRWGATWRAAC
ncbi:aldehyde dehydrogenase family protein [Serratia marcescens]